MSHPLFDSGFTLWAADLEAQVMERYGRSSRALGVRPALLLQCYYQGNSVSSALSFISERTGLKI
jgi:hypothetical protein